MASFLIVSSLLIVFSAPTQAQKKMDEVTQWLESHTPDMGGRAILMIYKDGEIIYTHAVNKMNARQKMAARYVARQLGQPENLEDYTPQTRLPVASCSKWLSAALVMTFVDDGTLSLSDTVGQYLPELSRHGKGKITLWQCLSHLTGIKAPPLRNSLKKMKQVASMDEAIAQIAAMPMEGEPGRVFHYSNVGLQIAGAVLEKVSGKSFETLFGDRLAKPLAMTNTDFGGKAVALPAGGAYSTPGDYMHFLEMILHRGIFRGKRILSEASVEAMEQNQIQPYTKIAYSPAEAGGFGYALGEWVMPLTHDASTPAVTSPGLFGSFPWVSNEEGYCAVLMTFYLKNDGRNERYIELKNLVDHAVQH